MKRLLLLSLSLMVCLAMIAGEVTEQQALKIAQQFSKGKTFTLAKSRLLSRSVSPQSNAFLYVFNAEEGGYIVISGDDQTVPILGYSETGRLDMENLPEHIQSWLDGYVDQIAFLQSHPNVLKARNTLNEPAIEPLLGEIEWGQRSPYNDLCPYDGDSRCPTGCAATAMAQVMYYHKWPEQTTKEIPGYVTYNRKINMPSIPISRIDWENILPSYSNDVGNETQRRAVAELLLMCGSAQEMSYMSSGSLSGCSEIATSLREYFDYDMTADYIFRKSYRMAEWNQIIYNELSHHRPVCYEGKPSKKSGHAFVIDGYDKDDYFHVNWGWNGSRNGYFLLSILDSNAESLYEKQYSMSGYNIDQAAVIGIRKNTGIGPKDWLYALGQTQTNSTQARNSQNEDISQYLFFNLGNLTGKDMNFEYRIALFDDNDNFILTISEGETGVVGKNYFNVQGYYKFGAGLSDGNYKIMIMSRGKGDEGWHINQNSKDYGCYIVIVNGNTIQVKSPEKPIINLTGTIQSLEKIELFSQTLITGIITNNGDDFHGAVFFVEDGNVINGRNIDIAAGETQEITALYTANEVGERTFCIALYTYNTSERTYEYVPFATGTITVINSGGAYLRMSPIIQNEIDGIVREDVIRVKVPTTNFGIQIFDEDVRCQLYKINVDNTFSDYKYVDKHLNLGIKNYSNRLEFELENIENGEYKLQMMFRRDGIWVAPSTSNVYVTVRTIEGDLTGDGIVDEIDLEKLIEYVLTGRSDVKAADLNGDGLVNGTDIVKLVNMNMGKE